jgi:hypothetical protein
MKIKRIENKKSISEKYNITVSHKELIIINKMLNDYDTFKLEKETINTNLYDKDEYKTDKSLIKKALKLKIKIGKVLKDVVVW